MPTTYKITTKPVRQHLRVVQNEQGWPNSYKCNFLEPGVVSYEDVGQGRAYLQKASIDTWVMDFVGKPVVIGHSEVTPDNFKRKSVGYITRVWYEVSDGWYWCEFLLTDDKAKDYVSKGYSVSCAFDVEDVLPGGECHAIKYDEEITKGTPEHLAIVDTPRYEGCRVVLNSKKAKITNKEETTMPDKLVNVTLEDSITDSSGKSYKIADLITCWNKSESRMTADPSVNKDEPNVKHPEHLNKKEAEMPSDKTKEDKKDNTVIEAAPSDSPKEINSKKMDEKEEVKDPEKEFSKKSDAKDESKSKGSDEGNEPKEDKKANTCIEALPSNNPKVENDDKDAETDNPDKGAEEQTIKKANRGVNYFLKLNTLKSTGEAGGSEMLADTLKHKVNRGINRYGPKEVVTTK